ncbi:ATG13 domain-containing protein [Psidium guajava]|nr:ATG13 domain-containing protein [Psidium guajava]
MELLHYHSTIKFPKQHRRLENSNKHKKQKLSCYLPPR